MIPILFLFLAQTGDPDEVLARGRDRILQSIDRLPAYVCTQTVERSEYRPTVPVAPDRASCDAILARRSQGGLPTQLTRQDRLRLEIEVAENGAEVFSWPGESRISSERIQDFAREGVIGTGAFGPFLINIFARAGARFWPEGDATIDGKRVRQYRYLVPLENSRYNVRVGDQTRVVPFEGRFWLDPDTGELRRLLVRTAELSRSTGNCEAATTVDFARAAIGGSDHLLAARSVLHVLRRDAAEQENVTTYSACREFRGESSIRFGEEPPPRPAAGPEPPIAEATSGFPPGVRVTVRFGAGIHTATSAAGDLIPARISHTESRPRRRLIPTEGAPARCRITRFETEIPEARTNISVACEAIELAGKWIALSAAPDKTPELLDIEHWKQTREHSILRGRRNPGPGATISVRTGGGPVSVGAFAVEWITSLPSSLR